MSDKLYKAALAREKADELVHAAGQARRMAHAPYSGFKVGAAALWTDGLISTGCNVENVSYGLGICAERNAITAGVALGGHELVALAVVSSDKSYPCGACLQFCQEFSGNESPVLLLADTDGDLQIKALSECLPYPFSNFTAEKPEVDC